MEKTDLEVMGQRAAVVKYELQKLPEDRKNQVLQAVAGQLVRDSDRILKENGEDIRRAEEKGMHPGLTDRLRLTKGG